MQWLIYAAKKALQLHILVTRNPIELKAGSVYLTPKSVIYR